MDLSYLFERQYIRATYKTIRTSGVNITVLRVYFIPSDVPGNRFLEDYRASLRRGKSITWHEGRLRLIMNLLLSVLDFSSDSWNGQDRDVSGRLVFSALRPFTEFHASKIGMEPYYETSPNVDHHITRMIEGKPFSFGNNKTAVSLEDRLAKVYNSVQFSLDRTSQFFMEAQSVKGLKSTLYNYQIESVAKMYQNESLVKHNVMPHLLQIKKNGRVFYFDTIGFTFANGPELYTSPKGGVLAENMGLGKTLICLALVMLTKDEISVPPDQLAPKQTNDYQVMSLMDQCVRLINRRSIPWKKHQQYMPEPCVKKLKANPGYFYITKNEVTTRRFHSRSKPIIQQEKLLLTSSTLIVCPDNLFHQWTTEFYKHIEDDYLSILQVSSSKTPLPSPKELSQFDIVLLSVSAFVAQDPSTSSLSKIYWKRFIIDEGHSMNQRSTRAVDLSNEIKVERRWAVTGTPTAGMTRLHMNETHDQTDKSHSGATNYSVKRTFSAKDDLYRLGALVYNFFQIEPWKSKHDLWPKSIVRPFIEDRCGSTRALSGLVNDLIIRHSVEQIENDVNLPPLIHKPVFLSPSFHNKLSVNLFVAVLAINAVSSEREDRDYMFHPGSKADLRRLVTNLQRATFYWTGFSVTDVQNMMKIAQTCLEKKKDDGSIYYSDDDMVLLERCIRMCQAALNDELWRTVSMIHEMTYYVRGLPKVYADNFKIGKSHDGYSVLGAPQVESMQKFYYKNRFLSLSGANEKISEYSDEFWRGYWKDATRKNAERVKKNDGQPIDVRQVINEAEHQEKMALKSSPRAKKVLDDVELIKTKKGRIDLSTNGTQTPEPSTAVNPRNAQLLGTSCAKLSYMVAKILENQYLGLKSIVFFEFEDSAYYLAEALDLLGLDYTLYATSVPKSQRSSAIDKFTTISTGHALIMDLKLASHGLTITAATRVYFLSPVWKRSVEAQAIKRAHRIGQTNPVHVETLILKGTLEEEMFKRRESAQSDSQKPVSEDNQIRNFISKFEFLHLGNKKRYSEVKSQAGTYDKPVNVQTFDEDELLEPSALPRNGRLHWDVPLFSKNSQKKVAEAAAKSVRPIRVISKVVDIDELDQTDKKSMAIKRAKTGLSNPKGSAKPGSDVPPSTPKSQILRFEANDYEDAELPSNKKVRFA